eukprot:gene19532-23358_t
MVPSTSAENRLLIRKEYIETPNQWQWKYVGLYTNYAMVGWMYSALSSTATSFCFYVWEVEHHDTCQSARNVISMGWNFKFFIAVLCESYRPFSYRRKPYILAGWLGAILVMVVLAFAADPEIVSFSTYGILCMIATAFYIVADVNADGLTIEWSQKESPETRGRILATGQIVRFTFSCAAGLFNALLMNGPSTNPEGKGWNFGLTVGQMFEFTVVLCLLLVVPIFYLVEPDSSAIPSRNLHEHLGELWQILHGKPLSLLLIYVCGMTALAGIYNVAALTMQFQIIQLDQFQSGVDTLSTYFVLLVAIHIFKTFCLNVNWRYTEILSKMLYAFLGLLWLLPIYDLWGTRNAWFTIFIDLNESFAGGLTQNIATKENPYDEDQDNWRFASYTICIFFLEAWAQTEEGAVVREKSTLGTDGGPSALVTSSEYAVLLDEMAALKAL